MDFVADDYSDIARRLREIETEKRGGSYVPGDVAPQGVYGIWFAPGDRDPGWCSIDMLTGKWGICRAGDGKVPSVWSDPALAQIAIANKGSGAWSTSDMSVRQYC